MTSKAVSALHDHVGYWQHRFAQAVYTDLERRLAAFNVTASQWGVIAVLFHKEADTVRGVAARIGLDGGAVSRLADRLAEKGLLVRAPDDTDSRSVRLILTDAGKALMPRLAEAVDANEAAWFRSLDKADRRQFKKRLRKLLAAIDGPERSWSERSLGAKRPKDRQLSE